MNRILIVLFTVLGLLVFAMLPSPGANACLTAASSDPVGPSTAGPLNLSDGLSAQANNAAVPIPPTLLVLGSGLIALAVARRRFKQ